MAQDKKTESCSINDYARSFLKLGNTVLPAKLHNALNTVFTKERDNNNAEIKAFRELVVTEIIGDHNNHYAILTGKSNAIYNALCLIAIVGVGSTKKIFQYTVQAIKKESISSLLQQTQEQALIFFCLGVHMENLAEIETMLRSDKFDLFSEKLPSPFGSNRNDKYDLAPMLVFFEKDIPWQDYVNDYQSAEESYVHKDFNSAKQQLEALEEKAIFPLPVVTTLRCRIADEEAEAEEAYNYLQSLLNN